MERSRTSAALALTAAAVLLVGCGSSAHRAASTGAAPNTPASSAPASEPSAGGTGASGTSSGGPADGMTTAAVRKAYETLFSDKSATPDSIAALQHGPTFAKTIEAQSNTSAAASSSASVTSVRIISPDVATVSFSITSNGAALLKGIPGNAVREDGTWKVAAKTFCQLLQLQQSAPSACNDPKITALPN